MPSGPMPPMNEPEPPMPEDNPEPPMGDEPDNDMGGENQEIDDIFNKLDTEKQAAVIKYAKSMINDNDGQDTEPDDGMPMESKKTLGKLVMEICNEISAEAESENEDDESDRKDDKIRNKKVTKNNPFISKQ